MGIGIVLMLFIVPEFVATPLAYGVYALLGGSGGYNAFVSWLSTTVGNSWYVGLTDGAILAIVGLIAYKKRTTLAGLGLTRPRLQHVAVALLSALAYIGVYLVIILVVTQFVPGFDAEQERDIGFSNLQGIKQLAIVFALLVVVTPLVEEIMFRGFLYSGLRKKLPFWVATTITSLAFGAVHLSSLSSSAPVWVAALDTCILSVAMCAAREYSKSLWPAIYIHAAKNTLAFVFLYLVK